MRHKSTPQIVDSKKGPIKKEPISKELQATVSTEYRPQKVTVEIPRTIQKKRVPIYNKDKYNNLRRVNGLTKLYTGFPKPDLENTLFTNIVKPRESIGQKQASNLSKNTK